MMKVVLLPPLTETIFLLLGTNLFVGGLRFLCGILCPL